MFRIQNNFVLYYIITESTVICRPCDDETDSGELSAQSKNLLLFYMINTNIIS